MSNSPEGSSLQYPQSGNTVEGYKEEHSCQDHRLKLKHRQQTVSEGIFPEQFHPKYISHQTSANWVSPKQDDHYSTPRQQLGLAPQHPPSPNNSYALPSSQRSDQEPDLLRAGVSSRNVSYEEFIAAEENKSPKNGFPESWPRVSSSPIAAVPSPPEEQPSPANVFSPPAKKASPPNVLRTLPPSPPPPPRSCRCCIIL
ncbi:hypothetical protein DITRI_Ditri12bG0082200 [Diplodiscus trichospermus]